MMRFSGLKRVAVLLACCWFCVSARAVPDAAALKAGFAKEYADKLAAGNLQIESDKGIFKGFCVGTRGGQVMHDFTKDAIAEGLAAFLRPELADVVKKASAK